MPLITPVLDDRSFEDLFAELRNRIPVYNPQWTDHLDSDPGITLLQLFAYLGEGLQFRFNQIPEATRLAFLKLLDIPLMPARPANALVRVSSELDLGVSVYAGDQLKAGKTLFTVQQDATVWPLDIVTVARQARLSDNSPSAVTAFLKDQDAEVRDTVQASIDAVSLQAKGQLESVAPYDIVKLEADGQSPAVDFSRTVDGCVWIAVFNRSKNPAFDPRTSGLNAGPGRTAALSLGFSPAAWFPDAQEAATCGPGQAPTCWWQASMLTLKADGQPQYMPLRVSGDSTQGFTREGTIRIELPADTSGLGVPQPGPGLAGTGEFPPELDDERADKVWFWMRVWRSDGSRIGEVQWLGLNVLPVEQSVTAAPELLGTGNGQPEQAFQLAYAPVLNVQDDPLDLQVEEGGVWTAWTQVENLDNSGATDRHFSVDGEAGTVRFGDNFPQIGERVRINRYRWGGGAVGNVPALAINKWGDLMPSPTPPLPLRRPGGLSLVIGNPLPAWGGVDAESIDAALKRIPAELRRNHRAVTRDDFATLALETPTVSIGRAECIPLLHAPSLSPKPGNVSVVVWPAQDPQHPNAPVPDAFELAQVCAWLDRWRLVTTELHVIPPTYQRVAVALSVKVKDGYGLDAVRDWVEILLRQYLSPMPPYGPEGQGWPLGRRVMARELEGVAMQAEGVAWIGDLRLDKETVNADGTRQWAPATTVTLADWIVPELAAVTVVADGTALPKPGEAVRPPLTQQPVPVPVLNTDC
ncbi:MAG: putative baseplate assembly protein [Aquabacterium sp.]